MREEEIIEYFKNKEKELQDEINRVEDYVNTLYEEEELEAIQGLLDLYNKEKEKNKEKVIFKNASIKIGDKDLKDILENYILKSKVKEKIEELDNIILMKRKSQINYSTIDELIYDKQIEVLQELLEGE